jgi:ataxia telangiectasia mutated family protein
LNPGQPTDGLQGQVFGLRDGQTASDNTLSAEHNWTLLKLLAHFSFWAQPQDQRNNNRHVSPGVGPQKRQRVVRWSDEIFRMLSDFSVPTRLCSLQIICFMAQSTPIEGEILSRLVEKLATCIIDDNTSVASWAYLALAR